MAVRCGEIISWMEEWAPGALAEDWDNTGLALGDREGDIRRVLVALDVTDQVAKEAVETGADLIITHHPLLFHSLRSITADTALGRKLMLLIRSGIAAFSAHTNLDKAEGGTNDTLARLCGLSEVIPFGECLGRIGSLSQAIPFSRLAVLVKERLELSAITCVGDEERPVRRIAISTGAGASLMKEAAEAGAEAFITGDLKFHEAQQAQELGLCVLDATHYGTEQLIVPVIAQYIQNKAAGRLEVLATCTNGQPYRYL